MFDMERQIANYFSMVGNTLNRLNYHAIEQVVESLLNTYEKQGTIFTFGNGGSGATASHFCGDLIKGASMGLEKKFRAICLNDNSPALLAFANDVSYDSIFVGQLQNFLKPGDLVIGFSGSGNSRNIVKALLYAKLVGAQTIAFCGFDGGTVKTIADVVMHAPVMDMEVSEDIHLAVAHCVKQALIAKLQSMSVTQKSHISPAVTNV